MCERETERDPFLLVRNGPALHAERKGVWVKEPGRSGHAERRKGVSGLPGSCAAPVSGEKDRWVEGRGRNRKRD